MTFRFAAKHGLLTQQLGSDMDAVEGLAHQLSNILESLELSASLDENHLDGGLHLHAFFMFDGSLSQEMSVFSMWTASTRTLSVVTRMQTLAALMLARATLSQEDLTQDNYELRWIDMVVSLE